GAQGLGRCTGASRTQPRPPSKSRPLKGNCGSYPTQHSQPRTRPSSKLKVDECLRRAPASNNPARLPLSSGVKTESSPPRQSLPLQRYYGDAPLTPSPAGKNPATACLKSTAASLDDSRRARAATTRVSETAGKDPES